MSKMPNFSEQKISVDKSIAELKKEYIKLYQEQNAFNQKIIHFLKIHTDFDISLITGESTTSIRLDKQQGQEYYRNYFRIFSDEGKIMLMKKCGDDDLKEKKHWKNFDEFSADISSICKILGCKKTNTTT